MRYHFLTQRFLNVYQQHLSSVLRQKSQTTPRTITTDIQLPLIANIHRRTIKKYVLYIGVPLTTVLFYQLWSIYETPRKQNFSLGSIGRIIRAFSVGIQCFIDEQTSLLFKRAGTDEYTLALHESRRRNAKRFANLCINTGGVYVKIAQGLIHLPELIPLEYYEELQVVPEYALHHEKGEIDHIFKRYFHDTPENIYATFDRNPKLAASLAEVYKATTKDNEHVNVKIQYSNLRESYRIDIATIRFLFHIREWFNPNSTIVWLLNELRHGLSIKLDFRREARNAERAREHFGQLDYVYIPKVYWDLTKRRVLTYENVEGVSVNDVDQLRKMNLSLKDIDEKLIRIFADQIFRTGYLHADPLPDNIQVQIDKNLKSKNYQQAQIVLLDHGLYDSLHEQRQILCELWMATINNDHLQMKKKAIALGALEIDYELFCTLVTRKPIRDNEEYAIPSYAYGWDALPIELQMIALKSGKFRMPSDDVYQNELTEEQRQSVRKRFRQLMDKKRTALFRTLQQMPKTVFLLLRNLNSLQRILNVHNVPDIDRIGIMTEVCQQALKEYTQQKK